MKQDKYRNIEEMEFIKEWSLFVAEFLENKKYVSNLLLMTLKDTFSLNLNMSSKDMLSGYREGYNDLNSMLQDMNSADILELDHLLFLKFGKRLEDVPKKISNQVKKRKKIMSDEEYRIVEERVSDLCQLGGHSKEIETLNSFITAYLEKRSKDNKK